MITPLRTKPAPPQRDTLYVEEMKASLTHMGISPGGIERLIKAAKKGEIWLPYPEGKKRVFFYWEADLNLFLREVK